MHEFNLLYAILTIIVMMGVLQGTFAYLILLERKVAAWIQDRVGPNRVGPAGLLQPIADGLKFVLKEQIVPKNVDKFLYILAPCIAVATATLAFAVVPFGPTDRPGTTEFRSNYQFVIAPGIDIGILFIFAVASLTVYGVILGGWSANNKYSFIGGLRASAQIVSYEIPMGMSIMGIILFTHTLNLETIIWRQVDHGWNILFQPLAFLLFMVSAFAECNRLPFDLPEAEQELIGGYHTEYSGWKFGLFFMAEYTHMITTSFLMVILFFGGWHLPWLAGADSHWFFKIAVMAFKTTAFILFYMLIRWTIPRFRFDQLMALAWKVMIPLAFVNMVCVMVVMEFGLSLWWLLPVSIGVLVGSAMMNTGVSKEPARLTTLASRLGES